MATKTTTAAADAPAHPTLGAPLRYALIGFGWVNVGTGAVGVFVPGLPTTPFLLLAAWAFSKSSPRFQRWLRDHKRLGPPVRDWQDHGVVPLRAKVLAVAMMAASLAYIALFVADGWIVPAAVGAVMLAAGTYVVTRPGRPRRPDVTS